MLFSGCGPGQFLGPTVTPSPTQTPTKTPTPTPTITPTPTLTPTATVDIAATAAREAEELKGSALALCQEKKPIAESAAYDPAGYPPSILVCDDYRCWPVNDLLDQPVGLALDQWTPANASQLQLVLCEDESRQNTKKTGRFCNYFASGYGSFSVSTYQTVDYYELYEAQTGALLKSFQIPGRTKIYCPSTISTTATMIKGDPDTAALFKQLAAYLQVPIPTPTPTVYTLRCDIDLNIDAGYPSGVSTILIQGEQEVPQQDSNDTQSEEKSAGKVTQVTINVNRTLQYKTSGHTYEVRGRIILRTTDPRISYDITATGDAFTTSPQTCTFP